MIICLKSSLFLRKIREKFSRDMKNEFHIIKDYLPKKAYSLLDIGCGVAGIDVLISQYYNHNINLFLIDKTKIDNNIYYSFKQKELGFEAKDWKEIKFYEGNGPTMAQSGIQILDAFGGWALLPPLALGIVAPSLMTSIFA